MITHHILAWLAMWISQGYWYPTAPASGGGGGGPALVQSKTCDTAGSASSATLTCTFTSSVTSGNVIIASAGFYDFNGTITIAVTDNCSDTYTQPVVISEGNAGTKVGTSINRAFNVTGGTCTLTATTSAADFMTLNIYEYSGFPTSNPTDQTGSHQDTSSDSSLTVTAGGANSQAHELVFISAGFGTSSTATIGAGYTAGKCSSAVSVNNIEICDEWKAVTAIETSSGSFTFSPVISGGAIVLTTFKSN